MKSAAGGGEKQMFGHFIFRSGAEKVVDGGGDSSLYS